MRTRVGVLALSVLVSAACGKIKEVASDAAPEPDAAGPADAAPPPGPCEEGGDPTYDEAYDCLIEAGCSLVTRCFLPLTIEQCRVLDLELYDLDVRMHREVVRQGIAEGTIQFHPEEVAACHAAVTGKECTFISEHAGSDFEIGDLCPGVFVGTAGPDQPCYTGVECEPAGSDCRPSPDCTGPVCCVGTCVAPSPDGGSCDGLPCGLGSHCVGGLCQSGAENQPCFEVQDCDEGFYCNGEVCVPEIESGAPCGFSEECPGPEICLIPPGSKSGTCARVDQVGAPCNDGCMGLQCDQPDPTQLGTCVPYLAEEGADCSRLSCSLAFECDRGADQCVPLGAAGADCVDREDCLNGNFAGGFCDNEISGAEVGQCSDRLADGELCTSSDQCRSDICETDAPALGEITSHCQPFPDCRAE